MFGGTHETPACLYEFSTYLVQSDASSSRPPRVLLASTSAGRGPSTRLCSSSREDKRSTRNMQTRRHRGIPSRNNKKYIVGRVLMRFSC